jgi:cell wall-associated NlpC family hydrolase
MRYVKFFRTLLSFICLFFILAGCAPSSAIYRYGRVADAASKPEKNPRYSKDTARVNTASLSDADLNANDEDAEPEPAGIGLSALDNAVPPAKLSKANLGLGANFANIIESMKMAIVKYDETPYHYGGNSLDGIDCSAFTGCVYSQTFKMTLPRSAREQYTIGEIIPSREELKFGDLVFFNTRRRVKPGHVGIYIGDNKFVHASSRHGVIVSSLGDDYYTKRYMGGRRVLDIEAALQGEE